MEWWRSVVFRSQTWNQSGDLSLRRKETTIWKERNLSSAGISGPTICIEEMKFSPLMLMIQTGWPFRNRDYYELNLKSQKNAKLKTIQYPWRPLAHFQPPWNTLTASLLMVNTLVADIPFFPGKKLKGQRKHKTTVPVYFVLVMAKYIYENPVCLNSHWRIYINLGWLPHFWG